MFAFYADAQTSSLRKKKIATHGFVQFDSLSIVPATFSADGIDSSFYFLDIVNATNDGTAFGAIKQGGLLVNFPLLVGLERREVEGAPAERLAGLRDFIKALALAFSETNAFLGAEI